MATRSALGLLLIAAFMPSIVPAPSAQNAPGQPIYDRSCEQAIADAGRMEADLAKQDDRIRRTEQMLASAEGQVSESRATLEDMALKAARDLVIKQLEMVREARARIEKAKGYSDLKDAAKQRRLAQLNQWVDRVVESGEAVEEAVSAGNLVSKRAELESAVVRNRATLTEYANFLQESGVSDDLGLKLATLAGPPGVLAVETFIVLRDVAFAVAGGVLSAQEAAQHRETLNTLKVMRAKVADFAFQLRAEATRCAPAPRPADRMMVTETPDASRPAGAPNASTAVEEKKGGDTGMMLLGAAAIAGGVGYYAYTKMCVEPTSNALTVCSSQGGSSSACKTALAEQDKYCKCKGFAGQSGGNCR